jgi:hypothetical protein
MAAGKTHLWIGFGLSFIVENALLYENFLEPNQSFYFSLFFIAANYLLDIDCPVAGARKLFGYILIVSTTSSLLYLSYLVYDEFLPIMVIPGVLSGILLGKILDIVTQHRGWIHTILFAFTIGAVAAIISYYHFDTSISYAIKTCSGLTSGAITHLITDKIYSFSGRQ